MSPGGVGADSISKDSQTHKYRLLNNSTVYKFCYILCNDLKFVVLLTPLIGYGPTPWLL